jgi:hypothetical protein
MANNKKKRKTRVTRAVQSVPIAGKVLAPEGSISEDALKAIDRGVSKIESKIRGIGQRLLSDKIVEEETKGEELKGAESIGIFLKDPKGKRRPGAVRATKRSLRR